jgi:hypothetical protein
VRTKAKAGNKVKVKRSLVQARVKEKTKQKLTKIAEISSRKLASYVALVLEDHAAQVDLRAMKALSVAWRGVKQDRNSVVRAEDGPKK